MKSQFEVFIDEKKTKTENNTLRELDTTDDDDDC